MNKINVNDKLVIAEYENKILKGVLLTNELERWVPGCSHQDTEQEHESRYDWVKKFAKGKVVLDIACGVGRGSYILATQGFASKVFAYDIDIETIKYASTKNYHKKIVHKAINAEKLDLEDGSVDTIVCFETIEHLKNPTNFLKKAESILKKNGRLIISTPISKVGYTRQSNNKYHMQEWGIEEFSALISQQFQISDLYLQVSKSKSSFIKRLSLKFNISSKVPRDYEIFKLGKYKYLGDYQIIVAKKYVK